jgi:hypothetical protein
VSANNNMTPSKIQDVEIMPNVSLNSLRQKCAELLEFLVAINKVLAVCPSDEPPNDPPRDPLISQLASIEPGQFENLLTGQAVLQYLNIKGSPAPMWEVINALTIGRCRRFLAGNKKDTNIRKAVSNSRSKLKIRWIGKDEMIYLTNLNDKST